MRLYFVRHGKSGHNALSDELRPLTPEGTQRTEQTAQVLKQMGVKLTAIYASPRLRAQQTAEIIGLALECKVTTREAVNFGFTLDKVHHIISSYADEDEIMFVGHNPSMSEVIEQVCGAVVDLPPGGVACVRTFGADTRNAMLRWFITPRLFTALHEDD